MANPHRILNVIDLQINGKPIPHKEISTLTLGGFERTSENSASGVFFKQSLRPFKLAFTLPIGEDTKIGDFEKMDNITLVLTADTGQSYAVSNAWVETADDISGSNLAVNIAGNPAIEVK